MTAKKTPPRKTSAARRSTARPAASRSTAISRAEKTTPARKRAARRPPRKTTALQSAVSTIESLIDRVGRKFKAARKKILHPTKT